MSSPQPHAQPNQEASSVNQEPSGMSTPEPGQISEGQRCPTPDPTANPSPAAAPEGNHHSDSEWDDNVGSDPECRHAATLKDIGYYMWTPF